MKASTVLTISFCFVLMLLSVLAGWLGRMAYEEMNAPPAPQVDTVWIRDTIKMVETKPAGTVVATLPVHHRTTVLSKDDNFMAPDASLLADNDTTVAEYFRDTTKMMQPCDSVAVDVPIEQRTYEGENYRAVVQGFRPELVSIDIRIPKIAAPATEPVKRWHFTVGVQLGYGFTPAGWQSYAGIGGTFGYSF